MLVIGVELVVFVVVRLVRVVGIVVCDPLASGANGEESHRPRMDKPQLRYFRIREGGKTEK